MNLYALIMAGGGGRRFWPASRRGRPKQFLPLAGEKSMIRKTLDRALPLIPIERVFVITLSAYAEETRRHLPELPDANLLIEPQGKNTGPCIAYGALRIASLEPEALMVVLPADHAIGDGAAFRDSLAAGAEAAGDPLPSGEHPLITFGITPTRAATGYGYIRSGAFYSKCGEYEVRFVSEFTEKPDPATARGFIERGGYYWNSGIFVWRASAILGEFARLMPHWSGIMDGVKLGIGGGEPEASVEHFYSRVEPGPVDKMILERSPNSLVIPVAYAWSDLGSWKALDQFLRTSARDNLFIGEGVAADSAGCLVSTDGSFVCLLGVTDLVVVSSGDSILVLDKKKSEELKELIAELERVKPELL